MATISTCVTNKTKYCSVIFIFCISSDSFLNLKCLQIKPIAPGIITHRIPGITPLPPIETLYKDRVIPPIATGINPKKKPLNSIRILRPSKKIPGPASTAEDITTNPTILTLIPITNLLLKREILVMLVNNE